MTPTPRGSSCRRALAKREQDCRRASNSTEPILGDEIVGTELLRLSRASFSLVAGDHEHREFMNPCDLRGTDPPEQSEAIELGMPMSLMTT